MVRIAQISAGPNRTASLWDGERTDYRTLDDCVHALLRSERPINAPKDRAFVIIDAIGDIVGSVITSADGSYLLTLADGKTTAF